MHVHTHVCGVVRARKNRVVDRIVGEKSDRIPFRINTSSARSGGRAYKFECHPPPRPSSDRPVRLVCHFSGCTRVLRLRVCVRMPGVDAPNGRPLLSCIPRLVPILWTTSVLICIQTWIVTIENVTRAALAFLLDVCFIRFCVCVCIHVCIYSGSLRAAALRPATLGDRDSDGGMESAGVMGWCRKKGVQRSVSLMLNIHTLHKKAFRLVCVCIVMLLMATTPTRVHIWQRHYWVRYLERTKNVKIYANTRWNSSTPALMKSDLLGLMLMLAAKCVILGDRRLVNAQGRQHRLIVLFRYYMHAYASSRTQRRQQSAANALRACTFRWRKRERARTQMQTTTATRTTTMRCGATRETRSLLRCLTNRNSCRVRECVLFGCTSAPQTLWHSYVTPYYSTDIYAATSQCPCQGEP